MLKASKNKMMTGENVEQKQLGEFHFSGGTEYEPQTVRAETAEEAEKIWQKNKKPINQLT